MTRPRKPPSEHSGHVWLTWLPSQKRWVITWSWQDRSRELYGFRYADTTAPWDEDSADRAVSALVRELESLLF